RRLRPLGEVADEVVHRVTGLRKAVPRKRAPPLGVVLERKCDARRRLGEDLVQKVEVIGVDVQLESVPPVLLQPRPRDRASSFDPQADLPFVLASLVLEQSPRYDAE